MIKLAIEDLVNPMKKKGLTKLITTANVCSIFVVLFGFYKTNK